MKDTTKQQELSRVGVQKRTLCSIAINAKAFEMLARMYSNPIKAIIQELSANAVDSHIRAGVSTPFQVKLPNRLDPLFKIRDFGVSMSPDVIYNVYVNYMKSDKTGSNDEIGYFGIGSKTPLAYTDSFNICTFIDGIKRMYVLSYNEDRIPELNEFQETATTEKNGVEISFAVKEDDFYTFKTTAESVFMFFDVHPTITGNTTYQQRFPVKILEGNGWYFSKSASSSYAIMGNVAYPINTYSFDSEYRDILNHCVVFPFNIGELNITPSREALEYTPLTLENIGKSLKIVMSELIAKVNSDIQDCKSLWEASIKSVDICQKFHFIKRASLTWEGKSLIDYLKVPNSKSLSVNYHGKIRVEKNETIYVKPEIKVMVKDINKDFLTRTRYYASQNPKETVYLVDPETIMETDTVPSSGPVTITKTAYDTVKFLKKGLGIGDENIICLVSTLPAPPKAFKTNNGIRSIRIREYDITGTSPKVSKSYDSKYWREVDVRFKDMVDAVYVEFDRYNLSIKGKAITNMNSILKEMEQLGIAIPTIYGITGYFVKKIESRPNFIDFFTWVKTALSGVEPLIQSSLTADYANNISIVKSIRALNGNLLSEMKDSNSNFAKLCNAVDSIVVSRTFSEEFLSLCLYVGLNISKGGLIKENKELDKLVEEVKERYFFVSDYLHNNSYEIERQKESGSKKLKEMANMVVTHIKAVDAFVI